MIKTLIVMTTFGQIFYSKEAFFGEKAGDSDISLTAGLISAIYSMTTETQQQKIEELELEDDRSIFRELPGEKLFIVTVDKRMDTSDANDLLTDMVDRFNNKYQDLSLDGMILSDFEPEVDAVVEDKLWYNTTEKGLGINDIAASLVIVAAAIFFPFWLLEGENNIIKPIKEGLQSGNVLNVIIASILIGLIMVIPLLVTFYVMGYYSKIGKINRFASEFLRRPTRGGYSEMLPNWFLLYPVFMSVLLFSIVRFGRGIFYGLTAQPIGEGFDRSIKSGSSGEYIFWYYMFFYIFLYLLTWYLVLPTLIGMFTQQLNWKFMKASWILTSISMIAILPAQIIAGIYFQEAVGFHPQNQALFANEGDTLDFLFKVRIPVNLFLFLFIFLIGVGHAQLIKRNKGRYPLGFGIGLFAAIAIQMVLFFVIFNSGYFFDPLFINR